MSWKDNEIDALFKGATPPSPPPFEEGFWDEMEAMLPEKKRRKPFIFWMSGIAAIFAIGAGVLLWPAADGSQVAENKTTNESVPQQKVESEKDPVPDANEPTFTDQTGLSEVGDGMQVSRESKSTRAPRTELIKCFAGVDPIVDEERISVIVVDRLPRMSLFPGQGDPLMAGYSPVPTSENEADVPEKRDQFYAQLAVGAGQSPMKTGSSEFMHSYLLGAGIIAEIDKVQLTYGLQFRMDVAENIDYTAPGVEYNRVTSLKNLYSLETPISLGLPVRKSVFSVNVVPGFQMGFSGRYTDYQGEVALKSARIPHGKPLEARTLTMEMGLGYRYSFKPGWQLGVAVATDVIRPFYSDAYFGSTRQFPVNGQVVLRRTF